MLSQVASIVLLCIVCILHINFSNSQINNANFNNSYGTFDNSYNALKFPDNQTQETANSGSIFVNGINQTYTIKAKAGTFIFYDNINFKRYKVDYIINVDERKNITEIPAGGFGGGANVGFAAPVSNISGAVLATLTGG